MWTPTSWYEDARQQAAAVPAYWHEMAALVLSHYQEQNPERSDDDLLAELDRSNQRRLEALPDLTRYPELRGMAELIAAERRGTRDGARLNEAESILLGDMLWLYGQSFRQPQSEHLGCTAVFLPDSDRGPLFAKNTDTRADQPVATPTWSELAINEHLIGLGVSCGIWCDEESPEIFPAPVMKLAGRYCRNTEEAVELLQRYNHFWGGSNYLLVDRANNVAMIEKSSCRIGVRRSADGFGFVTAMTMAEPGMRNYLHDRRDASLPARNLGEDCLDRLYWAEADHRHDLLVKLLGEARSQPTLDGLRAIMQYRDPQRGRVCYDGAPLRPGAPPTEHTTRTAIWELRSGRIHWWARNPDTGTPSFDNPMPAIQTEGELLWT